MRKFWIILIMSILISNGYSTAWDVTDAVLQNTFDLSDWSVEKIWFNSDGTKLFTKSTTETGNITQFDLSTGWDSSTITFNNSKSLGTFTGKDIELKSDGTRIYITDDSNTEIDQHAMSVAFNITTASFTQDEAFTSLVYGSYYEQTGYMYYTVGNNGNIQQRNVTTAWDISTITGSGLNTTDFNSYDNSPQDIFVKPDGTYFYVAGQENDKVYTYSMTVPFNATYKVYEEKDYYLGYNPSSLAFSTDGTKMFVIKTATNILYEYELGEAEDEDESATGEKIRIYRDWDDDNTYSSSYYATYNNTASESDYSCYDYDLTCWYYGSVVGAKADTNLEDMIVKIYQGAVYIGEYITDVNGFIYPNLDDGSYYKFNVQYINKNESFYRTWNATSNIPQPIDDIGILLFGIYDETDEVLNLDDVYFTITQVSDTSLTQTKTSTSERSYMFFYVKDTLNKQYSASAERVNYNSISGVNEFNTKIVNAPNDFVYFAYQLTEGNFLVYDLDDGEGKVTVFSTGGNKGVTAGQLISEIKLRLYERGTGFLSESDFTVVDIEIIDATQSCNEEIMSRTIIIRNLNDYLENVPFPSDCYYTNNIEGEGITCRNEAIIPYVQNFREGLGFVGTTYYFVTSFSLPVESLTLNYVYASDKIFCVSREDRGGCYLDYSCNNATTNVVKVTVKVGGSTFVAIGDFDIGQGTIDYFTPYGKNMIDGDRIAIFPMILGNGLSGSDFDLDCSLNITFSDDSKEVFTDENLYYDGTRNRIEFSLTPNATQNTTSNYGYNLTCNANGFEENTLEGTIYFADDFFIRPMHCLIVPSTFANGTLTKAICEVVTNENDNVINISIDTDVSVDVETIQIPLIESSFKDDINGYFRIYQQDVTFINASDDNTYTVTFTIDGNVYYPNMTVTDIITIDDDRARINIEEVYFDSDEYGQFDLMTCGVIFNGTGFDKGSVEVYSQKYYNEYLDGDLDFITLNLIHRKTLYYDETSTQLKEIFTNKYKIEHSLKVAFCDREKSDYQDCLSKTDIVTKASDTLVCIWEVNYQTANATADFDQDSIRDYVENPYSILVLFVGLFLNPIFMICFMFILLVGYVFYHNKQG